MAKKSAQKSEPQFAGGGLPTALTKRPPGRPKKADAEKLEQFSIRLPPRLKYSLELLARAQHRSLSQAVEWALQVGLNAYSVNPDDLTVAGLVEKSWDAKTEYERVRAIYDAAPSLCDFGDYSACVFVDRSLERIEIFNARDTRELSYLEDLFRQFASLYWEEIKPLAIERSTKGLELSECSVISALGLDRKGPHPVEQRLRWAIEKKGATPLNRAGVKIDAAQLLF